MIILGLGHYDQFGGGVGYKTADYLILDVPLSNLDTCNKKSTQPQHTHMVVYR